VNDQIWWYATRAAGLMTWATAMTSILIGLALSFSARVFSARAPFSGQQKKNLGLLIRRRPNRAWLLDLHRFVGGLSVLFLAIHMVTLWADSFVHFGGAELFLPFASEWRPLPVAFGVVSAWLLAGIEATSLVKTRLPDALWRFVHLGAYIVAVFGTVHAITAGSDTGHPVVVAVGGLMLLSVVGLTIVRLAMLRTPAAAHAPIVDREEQLRLARQHRDREALRQRLRQSSDPR
jgi:hypothetical protein